MHKFNYDWKLKDTVFTKDKGKVFSCFSCGGGSTMGLKLAGFDVIGNLEIDKRKNAAYVKNHNPKYNFNQDIREFRMRDDLPEELYNLDILEGAPPCFTGNTLVLTDVGYKPIREIKVGDRVWTHRNRFREVFDFGSKKTDKIMTVRVMGSEPFEVTENHPFYVRTMTRSNTRNFSAPYFKKAKDLTVQRNSCDTVVVQDYVGIPIIQEEVIPKYEGIEKHYPMPYGGESVRLFNSLDMSNRSLWKFVGRWLGDGWFRHDRKNVVICCGKQDEKILEQILKDAGLKAHKSSVKQCFRYTISNIELYYFMLQFGEKADGKYISMDALNLPKELLKELILGYLGADGYYSKKYDKWSFATVSPHLAYSLQMAIAKVYGLPTTMKVNDAHIGEIEGRVVNCKRSYHLSFKCKEAKQQHSFFEDGYIWVPFRESSPLGREDIVYNMSVEEDNTYTVQNIAVHNCVQFSMAGSREENWGKVITHDGITQRWDDLYFEFIELAKKLRPKVVVAENVKGLLLGGAIDYVRRIYDAFDEAGYYCQHFLLNASYMGVPQRRERVFFVCLRKDLAEPFLEMVDMFEVKPYIDMDFNEEPITCRECNLELGKPLKGFALEDWTRLKNGEEKKYLQSALIPLDSVHPTITEGYSDKANPMPEWNPNWLSDDDLCKVGSFPRDYDFNGIKAHKLIGRSIPPVMMSNIASRIYDYWLSKL